MSKREKVSSSAYLVLVGAAVAILVMLLSGHREQRPSHRVVSNGAAATDTLARDEYQALIDRWLAERNRREASGDPRAAELFMLHPAMGSGAASGDKVNPVLWQRGGYVAARVEGGVAKLPAY
jgi:hypothetical protein